MKRKELLAAGIVKDIRFANENVYYQYLADLADKKQEYEVLQREPGKNGTVLARIVTQYNDSDLIDLEG